MVTCNKCEREEPGNGNLKLVRKLCSRFASLRKIKATAKSQRLPFGKLFIYIHTTVLNNNA
jgi:hypothetical protein